ncbi:MAG: hypothetical protein VX815_12300 [Gemmatimonadota bacterium]|nr:hypothetical protein [Gemmatimonadota bacterium]
MDRRESLLGGTLILIFLAFARPAPAIQVLFSTDVFGYEPTPITVIRLLVLALDDIEAR